MKKTTIVTIVCLSLTALLLITVCIILFRNKAEEHVTDTQTVENTERDLPTENSNDPAIEEPSVESLMQEQMFTPEEVINTPISVELEDTFLKADHVTVEVSPEKSMPDGYFEQIKEFVYGDALISDLNALWTGPDIVIDKADFIYTEVAATLIYYIKDSNCAVYYEVVNNNWDVAPMLQCTDGNIPAVVYTNGAPENMSGISEIISREVSVDDYPVLYTDYTGGESITLHTLTGQVFTLNIQ